MSATWVGLIALLAMGVLVTVVLVQRLSRQPKLNWTPLPGFPGVNFIVPTDMPAALLSDALDLAVRELIAGPFGPVAARDGLRGLCIFVVATESWVDPLGRKVAGLADENVIFVGRDLAALCHELAHRLELTTYSKTDDSHATWAATGIMRAIDGYRASLPAIFARYVRS